MIIKSLSRRSNSTQLIKYATRYITKDKAHTHQDDAVILVRHNIRSKSVEGFIKEFQENESFRLYKRKDNVILFHTILSFSPHDKLRVSKKLLKDLAEKFIELRSPSCLNLAIAHFEKQHSHLHILTSGVRVNGRSSRVSKREFTRFLNELEAYQQSSYPELTYSKNNHNKVQETDRSKLLETFIQKRKSKKHILATQLESIYKSACSKDAFLQALTEHNHVPYFRNGKLQGIISEGKKYRLSTLGYTDKDFDVLELKETEQRTQLKEIEKIRSQKAIENEYDDIKENESEELSSIQSIRQKSKDRSGFER
ncbi:MAG: hypothetical protein HEQ40_12210 [Lacibacter sp.]|jgi:hypothetical protein